MIAVPSLLSRIQIKGSSKHDYGNILTDQACIFLLFLHTSFETERKKLMDARKIVQKQINSAWRPSFPLETANIRNDPSWKGANPAPGLIDRRVEITGPVERKMVINALNSGATQFMADFEDSNSPTWTNCMDGQVNLKDAVFKTISFSMPSGKTYKLKENIATLIVRPRGLHLLEKHFCIDGQPISASIFDFGLFFFHNAKKLISNGFGPYFYLPKLEHYLEARLWNSIFNASQDYLSIQRGTIRATVLIETILASFQMEEIIFELKSHAAGLNCGRWDYIFSVIKKFGKFQEFILPDRSSVAMTAPFMSAYVTHLIHVCHKRGVHAMGGMSAHIPIKANPELNQKAMDKVREDKLREVLAGHDGTWVAHPDLITVAKEVFDSKMIGPNQLQVQVRSSVTPEDLLDTSIPGSEITIQGLKDNIAVSLLYLESWLNGNGCIPINHLMEDAATAEIARSQIWQWLKHSVSIKIAPSTFVTLTKDLFSKCLDEVFSELSLKSSSAILAKTRFLDILFSKNSNNECPEFLTLVCYDDIVEFASNPKMSKL